MTFETLLFHPKVQAVGWALLHFLWQGALLAAIFAVANILTRPSQSRLRYAIGCIVTLLMPVAFIATVLSSDLPSEYSSPPKRVAIIESTTTPVENIVAKSQPPASSPSHIEIPTTRVAPTDRTIFQKIDLIPGGVVCLWLLGFFALSIYTATGWMRAQSLRRRGIELIDPMWIETLNDLTRRLQVSGPVRLYVSSIAQVPTVIGWMRPYVLLPVSAITGLSEPQLRAVLAHELAHIRRHDYLVNLLQNAVETLLFYHPAVWWVSRRIREERENCCDDLAVAVCGDVMVYAGALVQLEEIRASASEPALAATGGNLLARIRRLLGVANEKERIPRTLGAALAAVLAVVAIISFGAVIHAQSDTPRFEVADVHRSARARVDRFTEVVKFSNERPLAGRYDLRRKTILDLVETAYDMEEKVVGGPKWLELIQFDIAAKVSSSTPPERLKLMLQALLAECFKLVVHKETRLMPAFVLRTGKGPLKLSPADGSGGGGCQSQPQPMDQSPLMESCRNITMEAFGDWLHRWEARTYINKPVVDSTGLKGRWNFDWKWNASLMQVAQGLVPRSTILDAIDKQLGLKLESQKVPTPVLVIDRVNENPTDNPPDVIQKLPMPPTEFEVATIKPSNPAETSLLAPYGRRRSAPGGRIEIQGMTMSLLIATAWDIPWGPTDRMFAGAPKWVDSTRFDIVAKTASGDTGTANPDIRRMLRALLIDRFRMVTHEELLAPGYELVTAHPKLRKADPSNRSRCWSDSATEISSTLSRMITCQNTTMAQFAEQLRTLALDYTHYVEVTDATGIKGAWDFTVTFSPSSLLQNSEGSGRTSEPADAVATDPNGAISLFDALKKQLGLKLEMRKRMTPMLVIDHIEEKPTDN